MTIAVMHDDIEEIHAKGEQHTSAGDMRRVEFFLPGPYNRVSIWLNDAQAASLHTELERVWGVAPKPTPTPDTTPHEVVDAYADAHAALDPCEGCLPNSMMETSDRLANDLQRAIGILTFGQRPL